MIEVRIRDLVALIAVVLYTGVSIICFQQRKAINELNRDIEQRDSLINEMIVKQVEQIEEVK